jgi:deazaflavin-dependent oxidoreductase (nitroreductase family)
VLPERLSAESVCDVETIGRRSGLARVVEIWFAADPARDRIYLLSGGREAAHWVQNMRVRPDVRVRFGGPWFSGVATEIEGGEDEAAARQLLAAKYQGWREGRSLSGWARKSLAVAIDLDLSR